MKIDIKNKLVRDKIPELIRAENRECVYEIISDSQFSDMLEKKLDEEVLEFHDSHNVEELADIMEVVLALARMEKISARNLNRIRIRKKKEKGGFRKKILLSIELEKQDAK